MCFHNQCYIFQPYRTTPLVMPAPRTINEVGAGATTYQQVRGPQYQAVNRTTLLQDKVRPNYLKISGQGQDWKGNKAWKAIRNTNTNPGKYNALATSPALCYSCRTKAITNTNTNSALPLLLCFLLVMGRSYLLKHNFLSNHLDGQNIIYYQNAHKQIENILN